MDGSLKFLSGTRYEAKPNTKLSHVKSSEKGCSLKYEAITNLWNETWNALTGLPVKWQPTPNPPTGLQEGWDPSTDVAAVQTQLKGSSREHRITTCDATRRGPASEDGAEELLLSEGVFWRRHGDDERILSYMSVTVRHQIRRRLGHLQTSTDEHERV